MLDFVCVISWSYVVVTETQADEMEKKHMMENKLEWQTEPEHITPTTVTVGEKVDGWGNDYKL